MFLDDIYEGKPTEVYVILKDGKIQMLTEEKYDQYIKEKQIEYKKKKLEKILKR